MTFRMTTKEAVQVLKSQGLSDYAIAKGMGVQATRIPAYLVGSKMRKPAADRFKKAFNIEITDVFDPTKEAQNGQSK